MIRIKQASLMHTVQDSAVSVLPAKEWLRQVPWTALLPVGQIVF